MPAAVRAGAALGGDPDEEEPIVEGTLISPATLPAFVLLSATEQVTVKLVKETASTRIGIGLSPDEPDRAVVSTVAGGTPASMPLEQGAAASLIEPFDELLEINGVQPESAVHGVKLIREAPAGELVIRKLCCPEAAKRAALFLQAMWRATWPRREQLLRRMLVKPTQATVLGIAFSPDFAVHAFIRGVKEGGVAEGVLHEGDRIVRINGHACTAPADAAGLLRAASGCIELHVQAADDIASAFAANEDFDGIQERESAYKAALEAEERAQAEALAAQAEQAAAEEDDDAYDDDDDDDDDDDELTGGDDMRPDGDGRYHPPRAANGSAGRAAQPTGVGGDPFPTSPQRRLPPSLGEGKPTTTSGTRAVLSAPKPGQPPQGWRDWLKQRRSAAAVKPRDGPFSAAETNQRV